MTEPVKTVTYSFAHECYQFPNGITLFKHAHIAQATVEQIVEALQGVDREQVIAVEDATRARDLLDTADGALLRIAGARDTARRALDMAIREITLKDPSA